MDVFSDSHLVLCQGDIDEFSWLVSVQCKARLAVNGHCLRAVPSCGTPQ